MFNKRLTLLIALAALCGCSSNSGSSTISYSNSILNGSFEEELSHWTIGGLGAFNEDDVSDIDTFIDNKPSNKVGSHFYAGGTSSLPSFTGTLTSDVFTLKGLGYISLKIGAMKNADKCYIEFFKENSDEPLSFYANDREDKISKLSNFDFNNSTITSQLIRNIVDLREYLEENLYIKISDNDTGSEYLDYSYVNIDDIRIINTGEELNKDKVERLDQLLEYKEDDIDNDPPVETLRNGGFENGDLSYWKIVSGTAFNNIPLRNSDELYWGNRKYHADGTYFLDGFKNEESATGKIRSEKFKVVDKGDGYSFASVMIGGASNGRCYVAINNGETNEELSTIKNTYFEDPSLAESLITYYIDLSKYIGQTLYFTVVDLADSGPFGSIIVDDFNINISYLDTVNSVANLRTWAHDLDDDTAKNSYINIYDNFMSFPLKGEAPVISEIEGYALTKTISPSSSFNALSLFNEITVKDDYTGKSDLRYKFYKLTYNSTEVETNDYTLLDFSQDGIYELEFIVSDLYDSASTSKMKISVNSSISYDKDIVNGDFELGNVEGWTVVSGTFNNANAISNESTFWAEEIPFNKGGNYFLNGWNANAEQETFTLRSSVFTLSGSGYITFRMGGRSGSLVIKKEDGTIIAKYKNTAFSTDNFPSIEQGCMLATMQSYAADLSTYIGQNLYIELNDESISEDWEVAFFDEIKTYYSESIDITTLKDKVVQQGKEIEIPWRNAINTIL